MLASCHPGTVPETNWTGRLAGRIARCPRVTLMIWSTLLGVSIMLFALFGGALRESNAPGNSFSNAPESVVGDRLIDAHFPELAAGQELVVVRSKAYGAYHPEFQQFIVDLEADILALDDVVASTTSYYATGDERLVSQDGDTLILPITLANQGNPVENVRELIDLAEAASEERPEFEVAVGGEASASLSNVTASEDSLITGERFGGPVALVILLVVFGALIAAGLPLGLGVAAVLIALGGMAVLGQFHDLSLFVVNITFMIGLAVGIDYALFIIKRYREERAMHGNVEAIARTGATASRATFFSGLTVIVALAGMLLVPSTIFQSIALGAMAVVAVSVAMSLTLLPALLSLLDGRIERGRIPWVNRQGTTGEDGRFWGRVTAGVLRRPLLSLIAAVVLLVALALPYATTRLGMTGVSQLPAGSSPRAAFEILNEEFSPGLLSPIQIVIETPSPREPGLFNIVNALAVDLDQQPESTLTGIRTSADGAVTLLELTVSGEAESDLAHDTVRELREEILPGRFAGTRAETYVTGQTAFSRDSIALIEEYTPYVFELVLGASFLLLLAAFRSLVVPLKSILMNLLSVGATYGMLTLVFQHGVGARLFGFEQTETIMAFMPLFMFSVLFGLSMDYHVFILSRVKERYDETGDNAGAVIHGLRSTGSVVTGAALIMVAIFFGFALGDFVQMQQMGFGLAFAILLDATLVRTILLPATLRLLGDWNWYLPLWLGWLPNLSIEGAPGPALAPAPDPATGDD